MPQTQLNNMRITRFNATSERVAYYSVSGTDTLGKVLSFQVPESVFLGAARNALGPLLEQVIDESAGEFANFIAQARGLQTSMNNAFSELERGVRRATGLTVSQLSGVSTLPVSTQVGSQATIPSSP